MNARRSTMNIPIKITSNISGRVVETTVPPRLLLDKCDEADLIWDITACNCQPVGETNVVECNCDEEWMDCEVLIGDEVTKSEEGKS
jgi:hypothetical protein